MVINGITVEPNIGQVIAGNAYFFTAYALSSTSLVYNNAGGTDANAGWVPVQGSTARTIQYNIVSPTGTVTLSISGKVGTGTLETNIVVITSASATTGFINVDENVDEMRIGLKISGGAATVSVTGTFKGMQFSL